MVKREVQFFEWPKGKCKFFWWPKEFPHRTNPSINATFGANEAMNGFGIQSQIVVLTLGSKIKIWYSLQILIVDAI
jgi:hypothetical protein